MPVVLAAAVVVVLAAAGVAVLVLHRNGSTPVAGSPTSSAARPAASSSGPSSAPAASSGAATTSSDPARAFAQAMDALLNSSSTARTAVVRAAQGLDACTTSGTDAAAAFRDAAGQRRDLATRAAAVATAGVPDGDRIVRAFASAQQLSGQADDEFAAWADGVGTCTGTAAHDAHWSKANDLSAQASRAKTQFIALWNPLAARLGIASRTQADV
jgi:hypothetical protein